MTTFGPYHPLYDPKPQQRPLVPKYNPRQPNMPSYFQRATQPTQSPAASVGNFPQQQAPQQPAPVYSPTINTSITPQPIYSPQQTQQAVNVAKALQDQQGDLRSQMKQFAGPGRSYDAGTMAAAMPFVSEAKAAGNLAMGAIPLQDLVANQKNLLSGEIAREGEATGWGNLFARQYDNMIGTQSQNTSQVLGFLANLLMNSGSGSDYSSLLGAL